MNNRTKHSGTDSRAFTLVELPAVSRGKRAAFTLVELPAVSRGKRAAFTLVELLVVVMIMMIVVSLIVSVGKYVRDEGMRRTTVGTVTVVRQAIQAYYDIARDYPPDVRDVPPDADIAAWTGYLNYLNSLGSGQPIHYVPNATQLNQSFSGRTLVDYLTGKHTVTVFVANVNEQDNAGMNFSAQPCCQAATTRLRTLSGAVWKPGDLTIKDAWGNDLAYSRAGGIGGGPVVYSAGPDGYFGDDSSSYKYCMTGISGPPTDWNSYKRDDIRSD